MCQRRLCTAANSSISPILAFRSGQNTDTTNGWAARGLEACGRPSRAAPPQYSSPFPRAPRGCGRATRTRPPVGGRAVWWRARERRRWLPSFRTQRQSRAAHGNDKRHRVSHHSQAVVATRARLCEQSPHCCAGTAAGIISVFALDRDDSVVSRPSPNNTRARFTQQDWFKCHSFGERWGATVCDGVVAAQRSQRQQAIGRRVFHAAIYPPRL